MDSIKRDYPRKQEKITAKIHIHLDESHMGMLSLNTSGETIRLIAETKDISWGGFCLQFSKLPQDRENRFTPEKAHTLVGSQVAVNLSSPRLTLWGDVLRYDSQTKQMAIIITKVSDYDLWQELCGRHDSAE